MFSKRVDGKSQPRQARRDVTNRAEVFVYCERLGMQHDGGGSVAYNVPDWGSLRLA